ncbi:MAG: nitrate transporter permease [Hyphomicrobiales bacterium]|nr:nitrate transporter permease [Hyphomicrobiales bacterium]
MSTAPSIAQPRNSSVLAPSGEVTKQPSSPSGPRKPARAKLRPYQISLLSVVSGLLMWQFLSDVVIANPLFLASPLEVVRAVITLAETGELWRHVGASALEFALGYSIAALLGIGIGLLIATNDFAKNWLQPWISGFYATPTIALGPLFILWLGIGVWSKVVVVVLLVVFAVIINTEAGIRSTSERYLEMMRSFGATPRQLFVKVSLPSAAPFILAGLKLGIGRGLIGVVVAELFGSRLGLGRMIGASADSFNMPELFAAVSILAASGIAMNSGFSYLEKRLVPWTKD